MNSSANHNSPHHPALHNIERFPGQREGEAVRLCVRRHWISSLGVYFRGFFLLLLLPLVVTVAWQMISHATFSKGSVLTIIIYLLFAWLDFFIQTIKNETSMALVTNERLLEFNHKSLFRHEVTETNLQRVQDVRGITNGVAGSFLDVGDLEIETAGNQLSFFLRDVKAPQLTARSILEIQRESASRRSADEPAVTTPPTPPPASLPKRSGDLLTDAEVAQLRAHAEPTAPNLTQLQSDNSSAL